MLETITTQDFVVNSSNDHEWGYVGPNLVFSTLCLLARNHETSADMASPGSPPYPKPRLLDREAEVTAFLNHLVRTRDVAEATQNQALPERLARMSGTNWLTGSLPCGIMVLQ